MPNIPKVILLISTARGYDRALLSGITKYARLHGPWTFYNEPGGQHERVIPILENWNADGIVAHVSELEQLEKLRRPGLPVIAFGGKQKYHSVHTIHPDSGAIGKMAADFFLEKNFRNFAFCGWSDMYWSTERGEAFRDELKKHGFKIQFYSRPQMRYQRPWEKEQKLLMDWLKSLPKPVAVMACNDDRALHILEACKNQGISVPNEVAVLGVDNDRLICHLTNPILSSIELDYERTGYEAAEFLKELMDGAKYEPRMISAFPLRVIERGSTPALITNEPLVARALDFIYVNSKRPIQVTDVAEAVVASRRTLEQKFRNERNRSVLQEIRRARVQRVARMLEETNLSIYKIAIILGFTSVNNISRYFRRETGISPSEHRERFGQIIRQ
ncbi:Xylose operon regulatory protein [Limihaloglobus sulfuriphilus]|uniref:Xylose operon regulatory protein n=1 Tax=Limihaloglobus sulfuriphilus TaxID=1851148 RepID=A0A1Q2MES9_9BACT|nr:DNA-binding transcriptional regulator [Limihaloglobus sulfuriphilus]AQQ71048.1 Xylose operon regulatory protein [Limihaloglobus sulfuriphilus]